MGNCFESCSKRNDNEDDNLDSSVNSKPFSRANSDTGRSSNLSYPWSLKPLITRKCHLTTKCDVYSFGVVLLEILSGRRVIDKSKSREEENLVDWATPYLRDKRKVFRIMDTKLVGQYPQKAAFMMSFLALQCIGDVKVRPSMLEVVSLLEKVPIPRHRKSRSKGFACTNSASMPSKRFLRHPKD
ncbi:unnamed protein product [Arabidopsis thaliana]|uniref:(thale cress) hypothetical protein n=1 Tax=Arabidopsis thaliana TaxID=3702 RepID=A0A7G2E7A4_ARATH|nr:unnamed protein product [Arabidopsis thaliana]